MLNSKKKIKAMRSEKSGVVVKWSKMKRLMWVFMLSVSPVFLFSVGPLNLATAEILQSELRPQAREQKINARDDGLRAFYKDGLKFEAGSGDLKFQIGGRIMIDWAFFDASDEFIAALAEPEDGTELRRARFFMSGLLYKLVKYKLELDFAGTKVVFNDAYIGLVGVPGIQNINVGHFKEPFSLEWMMSSNDFTLMERSLANTLAPNRNQGIAVYDTQALEKRMTWALGVFRPTGDDAKIEDNAGYNITVRITGTPLYDDKGKKLLHLGLGYSYVSLKDSLGMVRFHSLPEVHLASSYVDTGNFVANSYNLFGFEAAAVFNSLSVQGEYMFADVDSAASGDPTLHGYYVEASYYLTGENRNYKEGAFGRTKVRKNFLKNDGLGAWQLALRYSSIDLNDAGVTGGKENNITAGLNWHLNNNTRVMFNYVNTDIEGGAGQDFGNLEVFQARFQVVF